MTHDELKQAAADFIKGGYWNTDYVVAFLIEQINKIREEDAELARQLTCKSKTSFVIRDAIRGLKIES